MEVKTDYCYVCGRFIDCQSEKYILSNGKIVCKCCYSNEFAAWGYDESE